MIEELVRIGGTLVIAGVLLRLRGFVLSYEAAKHRKSYVRRCED